MRRAMYARKKIQVFKHALDDRFHHSAVATHNGVQIDAVPVRNTQEILNLLEPDTEVVAIEEAQFFDEKLVRLCVETGGCGQNRDCRGAGSGLSASAVQDYAAV